MKKIPGESISESHAISLFLRGIKDPDFVMTVEIQKNKDDNNLIQSMISIHKQEMEFTKKGYTEIKLMNKTSHVSEEDDFYLEEDHPFKRYFRKGERYEYLVATSDNIKSKGTFLHVVHRVWQELYAKDRYFVV